YARRSRLEKQPTDLRPYETNGQLEKIHQTFEHWLSALFDRFATMGMRYLRACTGQTESLVLPSTSSQIAVDYQFPERGLLIVARTVVAVFAIVGGQAPRRCQSLSTYFLVAKHPLPL